jgi:hypothetical protein
VTGRALDALSGLLCRGGDASGDRCTGGHGQSADMTRQTKAGPMLEWRRSSKRWTGAARQWQAGGDGQHGLGRRGVVENRPGDWRSKGGAR